MYGVRDASHEGARCHHLVLRSCFTPHDDFGRGRAFSQINIVTGGREIPRLAIGAEFQLATGLELFRLRPLGILGFSPVRCENPLAHPQRGLLICRLCRYAVAPAIASLSSHLKYGAGRLLSHIHLVNGGLAVPCFAVHTEFKICRGVGDCGRQTPSCCLLPTASLSEGTLTHVQGAAGVNLVFPNPGAFSVNQASQLGSAR